MWKQINAYVLRLRLRNYFIWHKKDLKQESQNSDQNKPKWKIRFCRKKVLIKGFWVSSSKSKLQKFSAEKCKSSYRVINRNVNIGSCLPMSQRCTLEDRRARGYESKIFPGNFSKNFSIKPKIRTPSLFKSKKIESSLRKKDLPWIFNSCASIP